MRKANQMKLDSAIYTRLREVQMSEADRRDVAKALQQAERIADAYLWVKEKFADLGHFFLKPSLRH